MQAASLLDGFSFDLFPPFENDLAAPEVDVSRRQVVQALVVSTVVVVADELLDALFELSWQVVVVQQDPVFHRAMISLDLALRHRVVRPAADMSDAVVFEPLAKLALASTVAERRGWQRLKYSFNGHAETQQLVVTAGQSIDLEPHRQAVARKPRGNAQGRRAECRTGKRIP